MNWLGAAPLLDRAGDDYYVAKGSPDDADTGIRVDNAALCQPCKPAKGEAVPDNAVSSAVKSEEEDRKMPPDANVAGRDHSDDEEERLGAIIYRMAKKRRSLEQGSQPR